MCQSRNLQMCRVFAMIFYNDNIDDEKIVRLKDI